MPSAVETAFDVAFWFSDTALNDNEYLQPQKLHRLLYLAQAYFAVAYDGRELMPATFIADDMGPIEPNMFAAFSKGRPNIEVEMFLPPEITSFLDSIWRRFGHHSAERLSRMTKGTPAYRQAIAKGRKSFITLEAMRRSFSRGEETPGLQRVLKPKVLVSQTGRPVTVTSWTPSLRRMS